MKKLFTFVMGGVFVSSISPILDTLTERIMCKIKLGTIQLTQQMEEASKQQNEIEDVVITGFQPEK